MEDILRINIEDSHRGYIENSHCGFTLRIHIETHMDYIHNIKTGLFVSPNNLVKMLENILLNSARENCKSKVEKQLENRIKSF